MAKKKVLLVTGALCTGGAEKVARDLGLCAPGDYEIHYLVFETETGDYESALIRAGCRIHRVKHPRKRHLPHFLDLLRLLRREGFLFKINLKIRSMSGFLIEITPLSAKP